MLIPGNLDLGNTITDVLQRNARRYTRNEWLLHYPTATKTVGRLGS